MLQWRGLFQTVLWGIVFVGSLSYSFDCQTVLKKQNPVACDSLKSNSISALQPEKQWAVRKATLMLQASTQTKNKFANSLRWLRDGHIENPTSVSYVNELKVEIQELRRLEIEIQKINAQQAVCSTGCSADTKARLSIQYEKFKYSQMKILSQNPVLLHPEIEKLIANDYNEKKLQSALIQSLSEHAVQLLNLSNDLDRFIEQPDSTPSQAVLEALQRQKPDFTASPHEIQAWCYYDYELVIQNRKNLALKVGEEAALWGATSLLTPAASLMTKWVRSGLQGFKWGSRITSTAALALASEQRSQWLPPAITRLETRSALLTQIQKSPPNQWSPQQSMAVFKVGDKEHLAVLDLGKAELNKDQMSLALSDRYWSHVGDVYGKRLNLTEQEIKSFIQTSNEMRDRTILVTSSEQSPLLAREFNGGVGIVTSKNKRDLLPLEKATGFQAQRDIGGVAEVVRLTANKDAKELSMDLMKTSAEILKADPEIKTLYIYTSRAHSRLYKGMGVPVKKETLLENGRDVVIEVRITDIK